jgi:hypothetical protein
MLLVVFLIILAKFWSRNQDWGIVNSISNYFSTSTHQDTQTNSQQCRHVDPCNCFSTKDADNAALLRQIEHQNDSIAILRAALARAEDRLAEAETDLDTANNYSWYQAGRNAPTSSSSTYGPPYDHLQSELQRSIHRIATLEQEKDNLTQEIQNQTAQYHTRLNKLQAQVNYARGAGEDMGNAQKELENMKAKNRVLEREKADLIVAGMQTRQALSKEKGMHSLRCQDEAGCQMKIADLEYKCKKLMDAHIFNDKMVFDAALKFGMPKEEAQHIDLLSYVSQVTIELARLKAMGVQGATNTVDIQVMNLQDELQRTVSLKNRLEREVDRLGGDVMGIRNGWDTTRPKDWTVSLDTTYEENAYRMFPIYERLCEEVATLTDVFTTAGIDPPVWELEKARNDQTHKNIPGFQLEPHQIAVSNQMTNPKAENSDILTHKLTVAEVQRLYNRGLRLSIEIRRLAVKRERAGPGTVDPIIVKILENADQVFKDVIHEVLDDIRPLNQSRTDRTPDPRREKKFVIYTAMQHSITALINGILMNDRVPPAWVAHFEQSAKPWSSPDNLALNLINSEMKILESRINQLLIFINHYKLPGTLNGTPLQHIQNDPSYVQRWYELVAATGFARLTLAHWHLHLDQKPVQIPDEHGNIKTEILPRVTLLPLKHDKFFSSVLNRGESDEEKRKRELEEGAWPDNLEPMLVMDPVVGPKIEFKIIDPNNTVQTNSFNTSNNNSNNNNSNANNNKNTKGNDYEALRKSWETKRARVEQLKNHITQWGIKDNIALPTVGSSLRKNAEADFIKRANEHFDQQINMLTNHIGNHVRSNGQKYQVPKMIHKGGKMYPTS